VMFVVQNTPLPTLALRDLQIANWPLALTMAPFDLSLTLSETSAGLFGQLTYRTDLFQPATITRLARHFGTLLTSIAADPTRRLGDLPLLSAAEQAQVLIEWNAMTTDDPADGCLHEVLQAQAARTPEASALVCVDEHLTYLELNRRANQLAHYLVALGVGPETRVGICMERGPELIVAILGVLKAGGAYVPLDPDYPAERLVFMRDDAQVTVLITKSMYDLRFTMYDLDHSDAAIINRTSKIVHLDTDWPQIAQRSTAAPVVPLHPNNLAYVIYTSGSTGRPKGVQVSHANAVHSTRARMHHYHAPFTTYLLLTAVAFDASVTGIFWTLSQGARLVLPPEALLRDLPRLAEHFAQQQISHITSLASLYTLLLAQARPRQLAALKTVIVAGEACPSALIAQHHALLPDCALCNEYGPTEATVWSSVYTSHALPMPMVPIGRPITNTQIYLLDARLQPVPIGVAGELYLSGPQIARGYLGRPDLTAERFVPNPFGDCRLQIADCRTTQSAISYRLSAIGYRLYRTGDLARYLPDGNLIFIGRADHQVKLRGYRIELGEIETALLVCPNVRAAITLLREDVPGDQRLVAYVVPGGVRAVREPPVQGVSEQHSDADAAVLISDPRSLIPDLRRSLQAQLPAYMIPAAFVLLDALPLTPNGKVDRKALPAPDGTRPDHATTYVAPHTAEEQLLAQIWADLLRQDRVGLNDNFFDLGGHSLLATQVIARLSVAFGVKLPLRTLFERPTVAELAERVTTLRRIAHQLQPASDRPLADNEAEGEL
jgi:amino acid adenylation domain-containing protein